MSDLFWLSDAQIARLEPYFPKSHGKPRVDDRRVLSGIIFINRNGLRWRDAPAEYGPRKTLYNRWKRWCDKNILARMMAGLAAEHGEEKTVRPPPGTIIWICGWWVMADSQVCKTLVRPTFAPMRLVPKHRERSLHWQYGWRAAQQSAVHRHR